MLKKLIASLDDVEEKFRGLYTEQDDGTFKLDVEIEGEDVEGLKKNQNRLKAEKIKLKEKLEQIEADLNSKLETELEEKGEYKKLLEKKEAELTAQIEAEKQKAQGALAQLKNTLLTAEVTKLATELAGDRAPLILPHLRDRIVVNEVDGVLKVQFTDINGNPTGDSKSLVEEFKNNELFAPILNGRNSSGGGAGGGAGGGGSAEFEKFFDPDSAEYSITKQIEIEDKQPEIYKALVKKFNLDNPYG